MGCVTDYKVFFKLESHSSFNILDIASLFFSESRINAVLLQQEGIKRDFPLIGLLRSYNE